MRHSTHILCADRVLRCEEAFACNIQYNFEPNDHQQQHLFIFKQCARIAYNLSIDWMGLWFGTWFLHCPNCSWNRWVSWWRNWIQIYLLREKFHWISVSISILVREMFISRTQLDSRFWIILKATQSPLMKYHILTDSESKMCIVRAYI